MAGHIVGTPGYMSPGQARGGTWHTGAPARAWSPPPWLMRRISSWCEPVESAAKNRTHFLALCSQIMRRILVDHARRRGLARQGGDAIRVPLDEVLLAAQARGIEVIALDDALDALGRVDRRKSRVVELRYFGGLSVEEAAEVLGVSVETVKRDWRIAKAWLIAELTGKQESAGH